MAWCILSKTKKALRLNHTDTHSHIQLTKKCTLNQIRDKSMEFTEVRKAKLKLYNKYKPLFEEEELTLNVFITKRNDEFALYVLVEECTDEAKEFTNETIPDTFNFNECELKVIKAFGTYTMIEQ